MNTIPFRCDVLEAERVAAAARAAERAAIRTAAALTIADPITDEIIDALYRGNTVPGCPVYFNKNTRVSSDAESILTSRFGERGWSLVITHGAGTVTGCCIFLAK
jgi:hypothetical protein